MRCWRRFGIAAATGSAPQSDADSYDGTAEPDEPLRAFHLVVDADSAQQVGRIGPARGQKPAAGVAAADPAAPVTRRSARRGNPSSAGAAALWAP